MGGGHRCGCASAHRGACPSKTWGGRRPTSRCEVLLGQCGVQLVELGGGAAAQSDVEDHADHRQAEEPEHADTHRERKHGGCEQRDRDDLGRLRRPLPRPCCSDRQCGSRQRDQGARTAQEKSLGHADVRRSRPFLANGPILKRSLLFVWYWDRNDRSPAASYPFALLEAVPWIANLGMARATREGITSPCDHACSRSCPRSCSACSLPLRWPPMRTRRHPLCLGPGPTCTATTSV